MVARHVKQVKSFTKFVNTESVIVILGNRYLRTYHVGGQSQGKKKQRYGNISPDVDTQSLYAKSIVVHMSLV